MLAYLKETGYLCWDKVTCMKMRQYFYLTLLTLLLMACTADSGKKYVIGVSQCSEDIWRDKLNSELVMSTYQHDNITLKFASANDNDRLQAKQIPSSTRLMTGESLSSCSTARPTRRSTRLSSGQTTTRQGTRWVRSLPGS